MFWLVEYDGVFGLVEYGVFGLDGKGVVWLVDWGMIGIMLLIVIGWGGFGFIVCVVIKERSWFGSLVNIFFESKFWVNVLCVWKFLNGINWKKSGRNF